MNTPSITGLARWLQRRDTENELIRAALIEMAAIITESEERQTKLTEMIRQVDAPDARRSQAKSAKAQGAPVVPGYE